MLNLNEDTLKFFERIFGEDVVKADGDINRILAFVDGTMPDEKKLIDTVDEALLARVYARVDMSTRVSCPSEEWNTMLLEIQKVVTEWYGVDENTLESYIRTKLEIMFPAE